MLADGIVWSRAWFVIIEVVERLFQLILDLVHALLEALDALAQAAHELGYLPATEEQQYDKNNRDNFACSQIEHSQYSVKYHI